MAPKPPPEGVALLRIAPEIISVVDYSKGFGKYLPPYSPDLNPIENAFASRRARSHPGQLIPSTAKLSLSEP